MHGVAKQRCVKQEVVAEVEETLVDEAHQFLLLGLVVFVEEEVFQSVDSSKVSESREKQVLYVSCRCFSGPASSTASLYPFC